jgi:hypothetical protein
VLLVGDLIRQDVSIHVLCESRDPLRTFQHVMVALNLCALVRELALMFYLYVLDVRYDLSVLFALMFQSLFLEQ